MKDIKFKDKIAQGINDLFYIWKREFQTTFRDQGVLIFFILVPLGYPLLYSFIYDNEVVREVPAVVVDDSHSSLSREYLRKVDATPDVQIIAYCADMEEAKQMLKNRLAYGIIYIPSDFSDNIAKGKQTQVSIYCDMSGLLYYKSMLIANTAVSLIPGVLMLLIFMVTVYSIGVEIKDRTAREWLRMSNNSIYIALAGKLLPHTVVFFIMGIFYNVYLYGFLHFPCNSGIFPMIFATLCLVLASQCCGIVMIGTLPTLRLGLSFASLWGVISFSISGFSFPVMAMNPVLQALSNLFPLRHYFLIYVDQALNGYSMAYSWSNYMALLIFMMLPFFVVHRLKEALVYYKYIP